jgi:hypothetical protein
MRFLNRESGYSSEAKLQFRLERGVEMADPITTNLIITELFVRPGQSRYLLASHLKVPAEIVKGQLTELEHQGMVVSSQGEGDDEPTFWASKDAVREVAPAAVSAEAVKA